MRLLGFSYYKDGKYVAEDWDLELDEAYELIKQQNTGNPKNILFPILLAEISELQKNKIESLQWYLFSLNLNSISVSSIFFCRDCIYSFVVIFDELVLGIAQFASDSIAAL